MTSSFYVAAQFACFLVLAIPWHGLPTHWPGIVPCAAGSAVAFWAIATNRPGNFNIRPDPKPDGRLVTSGPYRFVRHPMYTGVLLFSAGVVMGYDEAWRWLPYAALAAVLHFKARYEERALAALHPGYAEYARRTAALVPWVILR